MTYQKQQGHKIYLLLCLSSFHQLYAKHRKIHLCNTRKHKATLKYDKLINIRVNLRLNFFFTFFRTVIGTTARIFEIALYAKANYTYIALPAPRIPAGRRTGVSSGTMVLSPANPCHESSSSYSSFEFV